MTDLILKKERKDDCTTTSDCHSLVTKSVNNSVITAVSPTGDDYLVEDDTFSAARSGDWSRHADVKGLCDHVETRLLLFQSSLDLFSDVRSPKPKSEQVEVSRPINKIVTKAETIDQTPQPAAQQKKKKSALKSCLRVEQGTCSTDEDFSGNIVNTFQQWDQEDDVQADDRNSVDFSEVTVRTFACRLGDNPSARSGVPITISGKPLSTSTVDINKYEKFFGRNRRRGNELLLSPQERSRMLVEEGYNLEEIAKIIIETEHGRENRLETMAKEQRWVKIRSILSLKPSSSFDLKHGGVDVVKKAYSRTTNTKTISQSPSKASLVNLCKKLKRTRSDEPPKCISVPQAA